MHKVRRLSVLTLLAATAAWLVVGGAVSSATTTRHVAILKNSTTHLFYYSPKGITVHKGDTVVWTNKTGVTHTVTFNNGSYNKTVTPSHSVSRTFGRRGTFSYHCVIHPYMKGTVTVT